MTATATANFDLDIENASSFKFRFACVTAAKRLRVSKALVHKPKLAAAQQKSLRCLARDFCKLKSILGYALISVAATGVRNRFQAREGGSLAKSLFSFGNGLRKLAVRLRALARP
jgi:hypothetical protein